MRGRRRGGRGGTAVHAVCGAAIVVSACAGDSGGSVADDPPETMFNFPIGEAKPGPMSAPLAYRNLGFMRPVLATHAPDGTDRVFVVEQAGRILVFANDEHVPSAKTFLDIRGRVTVSDGEQGLLGLAFHPQYRVNGRFYVHYMKASPLRSVIARYTTTSDPDVADPDSESVVLELEQPYSNHNSGMLAFGPDDMLYIGFGDGGAGGDPLQHAQNRTTLHGSILRIDVDGGTPYAIPADNPFAGEGGGVRGEIWAYGLRNPWRFTFDRQTGELWVGDVGQGMREEITVVRRGDNCGWRVYEGNHPFDNPQKLPPEQFRQPRLDYPRSWGVSVIGGHVYRGNELASLRGAYVFGDYGTGRIWSLSVSGGEDVVTLLAQITAPSSFGETRDGELLLVSHTGSIHRLEPREGGGDDGFPTTLSATGLFTDLRALTPVAGLHEYEVNAPFWSDDAIKRRWIAVPEGSPAVYDATAAWDFPVGTVAVKHFELPLTTGDRSSSKRLETRVLIHQRDGWAGYTYRWNDTATEATLLGGRETVDLTIRDPSARGGSRVRSWTFPSRSDCLQCHTRAAGRVLGLRTPQLERQLGGEDQIDRLARLGIVRDAGGERVALVDPYGTSGTAAARARAYLDVNCAMCHVPGGSAPTTFDLSWGTPDAQMGIFDARPQHGDLGIADAWLARRGAKEQSVLWERMRRLTTDRMPPLGSAHLDAAGITLVGDWLDGGH